MKWLDRAKITFQGNADRHPANTDDCRVSAVLAGPRPPIYSDTQSQARADLDRRHAGGPEASYRRAVLLPWQKPGRHCFMTHDGSYIRTNVEPSMANAVPAAGVPKPAVKDAIASRRGVHEGQRQAEHIRALTWKAQDILKTVHGWTDEQLGYLWLFHTTKPAEHLPITADNIAAWALQRRADADKRWAALSTGCCAGCTNRKTVVTDTGTGCRVARLQPMAPWRKWLDAEYEPNECHHFERHDA